VEYRQFVPVPSTGQGSPLETAAALFIAIVAVAVLYLGAEVLKPLALAALLSFVLSPVIRQLRKLGLGKAPSVIASVVMALGVMVMLSLVMAQQVTNLAEELPRYEANLREKIRTIKSYTLASGALERASDTLEDLKGELNKTEPSKADTPGSDGATPAGAPGTTLTETPRKPIPVEIQTGGPALFEQFSTLVSPLLKPVAQTGLVILFLLFILLQREDLRDRILRLGGTRDLQRSTVAMTDAGKRLSKFFLIQTGLNAAFGVLITIGLWIIGVPNPLLWGVLAALMRFVPFIGSIIASVFPIALAAAVDPGWSMVLATAALFLITEPLAGHVVEPLVYGKNTGLSPLAVVMATIFWTLIWGPIGLLLATPLTLCLVVLGNHVPGLSMLTVMLGDQPALNPTERLYQRLLVGDVGEAEQLAEEHIEEHSLISYYETVAMPALRLAQLDATDRDVPGDYLARLSGSVAELVDDLDDHPLDENTAATPPSPVTTIGGITCIGSRGWVDEASGHILAHVLRKHGFTANLMTGEDTGDGLRHFILDPDGNKVFCVTAFGVAGNGAQLRYITRRIRKQVPGAAIIACCWDLEAADAQATRDALDLTAVTTRLTDTVTACRRLANVGATTVATKGGAGSVTAAKPGSVPRARDENREADERPAS
jgi:predicted PurR-regulated permease PerM